MLNRASHPTQAAEASSGRRRWLILALLAMADFVVILDASIVNVALPSIGRGLQFSKDDLSWVVNAYVLTFGGFLLLGGRMADLLGRRRVFIAGLVLFALASLAGGLSQSETQLIAARAVQGLGAAILAPAALSLVTVTFAEGAERDKALGIWGAVAGSGAAAGVLLGGVLTSGLGWRWVLFVNVPIGLACALIAPRLIAESRAQVDRRSFDIPGALTVTAGLSTLVYALVQTSKHGWGSPETIGLLALAAALLAAFVAIEQRSAAPLVPFRFFRLRTVTGANATMLVIGATLVGLFFFLSLYMQQVLGYSALEAGITQLPLAATIMAAAGVASNLATRYGFKPVLLVGLTAFAGGLLWLSQAPEHGRFAADILGPSLLVAVGIGMAFVTITIAAVSGVRDRDTGLASGLLNTTQQIGGALGLAILATVANTRTDHILRATHAGPAHIKQALTQGYDTAFLTAAGVAALGVLVALALVRGSDSRNHATAARDSAARAAA